MQPTDVITVVMAKRKIAESDPRLVRQGAGITQEEMAVLVGVTASMMSRLEAGNRKPSNAVAIRWAAALGQLELARSTPLVRLPARHAQTDAA